LVTRAAIERTLARGPMVAARRGIAVDANHQSLFPKEVSTSIPSKHRQNLEKPYCGKSSVFPLNLNFPIVIMVSVLSSAKVPLRFKDGKPVGMRLLPFFPERPLPLSSPLLLPLPLSISTSTEGGSAICYQGKIVCILRARALSPSRLVRVTEYRFGVCRYVSWAQTFGGRAVLVFLEVKCT